MLAAVALVEPVAPLRPAVEFVASPPRQMLDVYSHEWWAVRLGTRFSPGQNLRQTTRRTGKVFSTDAYRRSMSVLDQYIAAETQLDAPSVVPDTSGSTQGVSSTSSTPAVLSSGSGHMQCIIQHESGGDPQNVSGQYEGIGQWSPEAWAQDGGTRFASSPLGASRDQQMQILAGEGDAGMSQQQGQFDGCG